MPRTCTVCSHPERRKIDQALLAGESFRHIAAQTDTSTGALQRHKAEHLPARVVKSAEGKALMESESLAEQIATLRRRVDVLFADATELLAKSKESGETKQALQAINAARSCISESRELTRVLAEMAGALPQPGISLTVLAPVLVASFDCIEDPQARAAAKQAVAAELMRLDSTLELPPA